MTIGWAFKANFIRSLNQILTTTPLIVNTSIDRQLRTLPHDSINFESLNLEIEPCAIKRLICTFAAKISGHRACTGPIIDTYHIKVVILGI